MRPAPLGDEAMPGNAPSGRSDINSIPMTGPNGDLPPEPLPPSGSQGAAPQGGVPRGPGALPRLKLKTMGSDNVAGREALPAEGLRLMHDEQVVPTNSSAMKLRRMSNESRRPMDVSGEPELLVPSTTIKAIDRSSSESEAPSSSINPLRSGVIHAAAFEEGSLNTLPDRVDLDSKISLQKNPLRR
jgi:hypothetical protein